MATIISDDPAIKRVLEKLVTLVTDNGARLHTEIEIVCLKGELSINSQLDHLNSEEIIMIPETCLPAVNDFKISLKGDKLIAEPDASKNVSKLHISVFDLMVELFNLTGKISAHLKISPRLTLRNAPNIIEHLYLPSLDSEDNSDLDAAVINSFIATRHKTHAGRKVLMPIIDCLNHHYNAKPFKRVNADKGGIVIFNSKPVASSNEVFVSYNPFLDALDIYKHCGFVDIFYPLCRSIPLLIDMGTIGKIRVRRDIEQKAPLDASVDQKDIDYPKDLHIYFPTIQQADKDTLTISSLIIPSETAPMSLRRILGNLIKRLSPDIGDADLVTCIYQVEAMILKVNHDYYDKLATLLDSEPEANISSDTKETLLLLIQTQKKHLDEYQMRLEN